MDEIKDLIKEFTSAVTRRMDDHDTLIRLETLQTSTNEKLETIVAKLEDTASAEVARDHERRLRVIERILFYGLGAVAFAYAGLKLLQGLGVHL